MTKAYSRDEILLSLDLMKNINSYHMVGQQYLDKSFFCEIMAKAFWEPKVLLYPEGRPHPLISKNKADIQSTDVYIYFLDRDIGFQCVGVQIGPHRTFLNEVYKNICSRAAK